MTILAAISVTLATVAAGEDPAADLARCERTVEASPGDAQALACVGRALISLKRFYDATHRLSAAGVVGIEIDSLLAVAAYQSAEHIGRSGDTRGYRKTAAEAADRALRAGAAAKTLHAIRTLALRRLGAFDEARASADAWIAADPDNLVAKSTLRDIETSRVRWAPLAAVAPAETPSIERKRPADIDRLVKKLGPKTVESIASEAERLLELVTDRGLRVHLVVLQLATRRSVGSAELAALEALDAGWLHEDRAIPLMRAVRRLDTSRTGEDRLYLDGATAPRRLDAAAPQGARLRYIPHGARVSVELLVRIEADGSVGSIVPLVAGPSDVRMRLVEGLRSSRYEPAVRDGLPVVVPLLECALVSTGEVTIFGQIP